MTTKDTIFQPPFMEIHVWPPFRRRIFDDFLGNTMVATAAISRDAPHGTNRQDLESAVVRFGGDSGDGMQMILLINPC